MTNLIIYHAKCVDGLGALWAATKHLGLYSEMHAATYGSEPPDVTGKNVYILDFSYPRDIIIEMAAKAASLQIIDHHATAEKNLDGLSNVKFDMSKSGAVLAWEFFHGDAPIPEILLYIQDRDLWQWQLPDSHAINEFLRFHIDFNKDVALNLYMLDCIRAEISVDGLTPLVDLGGRLLEVKESRVKRLTERPFVLTFILDSKEIKVPATFAESDICSEVGGALAEKTSVQTGCVILPMGSNEKYGLSFRSRGTSDLALQLAESFGGGGHLKAAGCGVTADTLAGLLGNSYLLEA